jgi:hypothetical protein
VSPIADLCDEKYGSAFLRLRELGPLLLPKYVTLFPKMSDTGFFRIPAILAFIMKAVYSCV